MNDDDFFGLDDDDPSDDAWEEWDGNCHWCGGDGFSQCDDPIQCTNLHNSFGECRCLSCGGSGLAKDMTIW